MLTNFEHITQPLSRDEMSLVPVIIEGFLNHKGIQNAIMSKEIVRKMKEKGYNITDVRLRKIVNHIRSKGLAPICSSSKGYWYSTVETEIMDEINSLTQRANAIMSAIKGLNEYRKNCFKPRQIELV